MASIGFKAARVSDKLVFKGSGGLRATMILGQSGFKDKQVFKGSEDFRTVKV